MKTAQIGDLITVNEDFNDGIHAHIFAGLTFSIADIKVDKYKIVYYYGHLRVWYWLSEKDFFLNK